MPVSSSVLRYGSIVEGLDQDLSFDNARIVAEAIAKDYEKYNNTLCNVLHEAGYFPVSGLNEIATASQEGGEKANVVSFPDIEYEFKETLIVNARLCLTVCHGEGMSKIWARFVLNVDKQSPDISNEKIIEDFRVHCEEISSSILDDVLEFYLSDIESTFSKLGLPSDSIAKSTLSEFGKLIMFSSDLVGESAEVFFDDVDNYGLKNAFTSERNGDFYDVVTTLHQEVENKKHHQYVRYDSCDYLTGVFIRSVSDKEVRLTGFCKPDESEFELTENGVVPVRNSSSQQLTRDLSIQYGREF